MSENEITSTDAKAIGLTRVALAAMRAANLASVDVTYSGSSDDFNGFDVDLNSTEQNRAASKAAEDLAEHLVDEHHDGFWNCNGGHGSVSIILNEDGGGRVVMQHYSTEINTETETHTLAATQDAKLLAILEKIKQIPGHPSTGTIEFEGSGDQGNVEHVDPGLEDLEDWAWDYLEAHHGGWEIGEGGGATFDFDLAAGTVEIELRCNTEDEYEGEEITIDVPATQEQA